MRYVNDKVPKRINLNQPFYENTMLDRGIYKLCN